MQVVVVVLLAAIASTAAAQSFPVPGKPLRIVVPTPAAGTTDIQARAIGQQLAVRLNVPVIVENRPGASTIIGAREVQRAAPDGHTLLYTFSIHVQVPHLYKIAPWDVFRDFTPITTGGRACTELTAHASAPFNTVQELVAYAKANPGRLNYASYGAGTTSHLNAELFKRLAGIDMVHVPYKGSGDAVKDHLAGTVQLFFDGPMTALGNAKTGKVKLIATAAETRNPDLPDLPTMREAGYDVGMWAYLWFWGPARMPSATVDILYRHIASVVASAEIRELFSKGGSQAEALPPAEMARVARDLDRRWGAVIRDLGIKLDEQP
jgi:tripartite-type tricarboxylate transporter receptor subunit TctC